MNSIKGKGQRVKGKVNFTLVLIFLAFVTTSAYAQRTISLEECLHIAHKQSPALFEAKRKYEIARDNAEANALSLRTKIDLTLNAPYYYDNTSPIFNPSTDLYQLYTQRITQLGTAGEGLLITQPIEWTGGTLYVSGNLYHQTQVSSNGPTISNYLGGATFTLSQPIFEANAMAITSHESDMALEDARAQYATQWASLNYNIKNLFYGLYQAEEQLQIQQDEVTASQSNFDIADNKYKAGLIAEVDKLQLEADLASAQTDLFNNQRLCASAQRDLEIALGLPFSDLLSARLDTLPDVNVSIDRESAIRSALANREDVLAAHQAITLGEDNLALTGNKRTINASLIGSFGPTIQQNALMLSQIGENPAINNTLTLLVTIPIFDWGEHAAEMDAAQSGIDLNQTLLSLKEQQVKQEVLNAIDQIEAAKKQVEVAKKSVAVAEKAYELSRERFDVGKITSPDLTLAQERVTRARISALSAEVAEHLALADLTQKTLFDYETGKPVVPEE
jgi:outer membrane protein